MPPDATQLPADQPGPGESQEAFLRRTGQAPAETGALPGPSIEQLRAQLEEAERQQADQNAERQGAALGAVPGPPAGAAAAVAAGTAGQAQMPANLAAADVGSLGTGGVQHEQAMEITHTEPVLAQGASGEAVQRLVRLLASAGYASNTVVNADPANTAQVLDASVMADVERFWNDHPEARESDELFYGREGDLRELRGTWVGPHTWQVLYNLATAKA